MKMSGEVQQRAAANGSDSQSSPAGTGGGAETVSFEESLGKLEQIVRQLEDGSLGLSDSLARYEEGLNCLRRCHEALGQAERRIELLTRVDERGEVETVPFDEQQMTLEEKAASRGKRRSGQS